VSRDDIAVLANPSAGRGRHRGLLPGVIERLGASGRTVRLLSADSGEAAEKACHRAVAEGVGALVAVGGDGTVHRAVQAVAGTGTGFGVVPAGTGNDFASGTHVPADPMTAATAIATAVREGRSTPVDLARVTTVQGDVRWFGAVLAAGFDAIVNERANRMRWPRGPRRYDLAIVLEMARLRPRSYRLELDGVDRSFAGVLVAIGNCRSYGGGMLICPDADHSDGQLDVTMVQSASRAKLIRLFPTVFKGTHVDLDQVRTARAKVITVECAGINAYADGEFVCPLPVEVTAVPGALRILRPAG
jgi:diacylglycerol kinase (ATP)